MDEVLIVFVLSEISLETDVEGVDNRMVVFQGLCRLGGDVHQLCETPSGIAGVGVLFALLFSVLIARCPELDGIDQSHRRN